MPLPRSCGMPGGRLGLALGEAPEQRLAKRAQDLEPAMNPALTAAPPRLPGSGGSAADRRGRVRPWASRAPSRRGVQRPPRSPGEAGTRRGPPHRSHPPAACTDDAGTIRWGPATTGQARPGAPGRSIWRPNAPPGGQPECPQQGASQAEPALGASPADRPGTGVMWSKFRQECYAGRVLQPNST